MKELLTILFAIIVLPILLWWLFLIFKAFKVATLLGICVGAIYLYLRMK